MSLPYADLPQLQGSWSSGRKLIDMNNAVSDQVASLDLSILRTVIPKIDSALELEPKEQHLHDPKGTLSLHPVVKPESYSNKSPRRSSFWNVSSHGEPMCFRGCYDLREEVLDLQYDAVLETQDHLRRLGMLCPLDAFELDSILAPLEKLLNTIEVKSLALKGLFDDLNAGSIVLLKGLDSGFTLPDNRAHLWPVSQSSDRGEGLIIYVSQKAPDLPGTILHTYLAHMGVSREQRFETELLLSQVTDLADKSGLPPRLESELESSTYAELLFLLEQIHVADTNHPILRRIADYSEQLLIPRSSLLCWTQMHSQKYLEGTISAEQLLARRLEWYRTQGLHALPNLRKLSELFSTVDKFVLDALYQGDQDLLAACSQALLAVYTSDSCTFVDMNADLFALMFFCALRRYAFDDVYLETTDRCPLFLQQDDQAAVFAELWVLGSQCEIYFGVRPRALGKIIHTRRRAYLSQFPPPSDAFDGLEVMTAYHKVEYPEVREGVGRPQIEPQINRKTRMVRKLSKLGFLTIFCVPAIIDVVLLTFLGRGLYLTAFMDPLERVMANYAILTTLLLTAGVTGWAGSTGGFYLHNVSML